MRVCVCVCACVRVCACVCVCVCVVNKSLEKFLFYHYTFVLCILQYYSSQLTDYDDSLHSRRNKSHGLPSLRDILNDLLTSQETEPSKSKSNSLPITTPHSTSYCIPLFRSNSTGLTKQQPAHDCNHVRFLNRSAENGVYWIDPNLGCSSDAILVYCNFTLNETCISPIVSL